MLRSAIIAPNADLARLLTSRLEQIGGAGVVRHMDHYPNSTELPRFLRGTAPQVVFLSVEDMRSAAEVAAGIESFAVGTQVVAIHRAVDSQLLLEVMRVGIREFLAAPFDGDIVTGVLKRTAEALQKRPVLMDASDQLYAFLPAKQGVGATTVAVNVSAALARRPDQNVLLADCDLNSGLVGFMLKLERSHSIVDAAENASRLDETMWPQMVTSLGRLDILQSGFMNPNHRIEPVQVRHILDFARRNYKVICADLSGNMELYSIEILHEATRIFLVVTPEIPVLHLAREKLSFLRNMDIDTSIRLLVNRAQKRGAIPLPEIERLLGMKVTATFVNDYNGVQRAVTAGTTVAPDTELGKSFDRFAKSLLEKEPVEVEAKHRFVEYFSLMPARYTHQGSK